MVDEQDVNIKQIKWVHCTQDTYLYLQFYKIRKKTRKCTRHSEVTQKWINQNTG